MPDENNDLNNAQPVTEPDLNAEAVIQPDLTDQPVQDQNQEVLADGTTKDKTVKYEELEKAVQGRKAAEEQAAHAQRQLDLMQMNAQQQQVQPQVPKSSMEQALIDCGTTAEDMGYDGNMQVKVMNRKDELDAARMQQSHIAMSTQQFAMSHPDMNEVVGSVNLATGIIVAPTQELLMLVQKKPYLAQASTTDIYNAVLHERKFSEYEKASKVQQEHLARQGVKVETQPLGGSAAGGGGSGSQGSQQLMGREQTAKIEADLAAGKYS